MTFSGPGTVARIGENMKWLLPAVRLLAVVPPLAEALRDGKLTQQEAASLLGVVVQLLAPKR